MNNILSQINKKIVPVSPSKYSNFFLANEILYFNISLELPVDKETGNITLLSLGIGKSDNFTPFSLILLTIFNSSAILSCYNILDIIS